MLNAEHLAFGTRHLAFDEMTQRQAETVANVVLTAAVVGAACYVLRTPPLRRLAFQTMKRWAMGPLALWAATEVRRAWDESGHPTSA